MRNIHYNFSRIKFYPGQNILRLVVLIIILIASVARITIYGDPNLSIGGNDTLSFVKSSQVPLLSSKMWTNQRLLTTNLLYKVFEPKAGYPISVNGSIDTTRRVVQDGFNKIVIAQLSLSILAWGLLAFFVSDQFKNPFTKILSAVILLLFAHTPQMADWDSILMSESLNFSLFALQLAILFKLVFSLYKDPHSSITTSFVLWMIVYFLWTFVRPTNLFAAPIGLVMIASLFFFIKYRGNKYLYAALLFMGGVFLLGTITTSKSVRSLNYDLYKDDLLSSPARVAILENWGMPPPKSPEFNIWFKENSSRTFIKFMFNYPGYPATKIIKDFPLSFTEIKQTYFKAPEQRQIREILMTIGDALHPENMTPFLMGLILLLGLVYLGTKKINNSQPWSWLGVWLFLIAGATLILSILGDTWGLNRHALFSTMTYRLCMWLFTIVMMDIAMDQNAQISSPSIPPQIR